MSSMSADKLVSILLLDKTSIMSYRYFILLSYNGKNYVGWQIQPNGMSVQESVQKALTVILRKQIEVVGAGRTDSGVHARKMYAHFEVDAPLDNIEELVRRLNNFLPHDLVIHSIRPVSSDAHARFSALARTYKYYVTTVKDPFLNEVKRRVYFEPDVEAMNRACELLMKYDDFTSFSKLHSDAKTNLCKVTAAYWVKEGSDYTFTITSNRFLRDMVRAIVGTLLEVGKGKLSLADFKSIIEQEDRQKAGDSAPAHGLFLEEVVYPEDIWL